MNNPNRIDGKHAGWHIALVLAIGMLGLLALQVPLPAAASGVSKTAQRAVPAARPILPGQGLSTADTNAPAAVLGSWASLPNDGLNGTVRAMIVYGNELYVGGDFTATNDNSITLNHIAKFNGTSWTALPKNGLNSTVYAFAIFNNELYVAGEFTNTGDSTVPLLRVARLSNGSWSKPGSDGFSSTVLALSAWNGDLYAGGVFLKISGADVTVNRIAKFNGTSWSALPNSGLNGTVYALYDDIFNMYAGGDFSNTGDNSTELRRMGSFAGSWSPLAKNGLNGTVRAINLAQGQVYVGGDFTATGDTTLALQHIATYSGNSWSALSNNGLNGSVYAVGEFGTDAYMGGAFTQTVNDNIVLNRLARYDGSNWSAVPNNGLGGAVNAIAAYGSAVYVGGDFTATADNAKTLNRIGKLIAPTQAGPTFIVNSNADTDDGLCDEPGQGGGNKDCTLREAINAANARSGTDTITFGSDYTILLGSTLPTITDNVTITNNAKRIILDANQSHRHFIINSGGTLTLSKLTLKNGMADTILGWGKSGASIYNNNGVLTVLNSTFENNNANDYGGAIFADGTTSVFNSTFHTNTAHLGGAILNVKPLTVKNSTLSYGEVFNLPNDPGAGAGIYNQDTLTLVNTIIANSAGPDCTNNGTIPSGSAKNNLMESTGASACGLANGVNGNKVGVDPKLGGLADNGAKTQTFALLTGSPAIDAGDNTTCAEANLNNKDQRGITRPVDGDGNGSLVCDIGAYEAAKPGPTATQTRTPTKTATGTVTKTATKTPTKTSTAGASRTPTRTATRTVTPSVTPGSVCNTKPTKPQLLKPKKNSAVSKKKVPFDWSDSTCATSYTLTVKNVVTGAKKSKTVTTSDAKLNLGSGTFQWFVQACGPAGCIKSAKWKFTH